jgi:hypothetical protein
MGLTEFIHRKFAWPSGKFLPKFSQPLQERR